MHSTAFCKFSCTHRKAHVEEILVCHSTLHTATVGVYLGFSITCCNSESLAKVCPDKKLVGWGLQTEVEL